MASIKTMLQIQDNMSAPLLNITSVMHTMVESMADMQATTNTSFNSAPIDSMRSGLDEANAALNQIADTANEATRNQDQFTNSIDRSVSSANDLSSAFSNFLQSIGAMTLLNKAVNMVTSSVDSAISRFDTLNNFPKRMEQMGYSAEEASASINRLSDGLQGLPTALNDMTGVVSRFEVITKSLDYSTESALSLNNALLASGASTAVATNATEQYLQMLGNATVDAQSWRSMVNGATYAMNELAESFDYTSIVVGGDFYTALQNGEVTMAELNSRMIELNNTTGGFAEVAKTATGGIGTAWENMQTAITRGVTTVVNALDSVFANTSFGSLEGAITSLGATFNSVLNSIASGVAVVGGLVVQVGSFFSGNWSIISPIIYGIVAAMVAYNSVLAINSVMQGISNAQKAIAAIRAVAHGTATAAEAAATAGMTQAQLALNAAIYASPITWVLAGIIAIIVVIYTVIAVINKVTNSSISALGIITGALATAGAFIWNLVTGLLNSIIQAMWTIFVDPFLGIIEFVLNIANNGFNSFVDGVVNALGNIIAWVLNIAKVVTTIIDAIGGKELTAKLSSVQDSLRSWGKNENAITLDRNATTINRIAYTDAFDTGYSFGQGIGDTVSNLFNPSDVVSNVEDTLNGFNLDDYLADTVSDDSLSAGTSESDYLSNIDDNTADIATAVLDTSDAQLKYLKEIAERLAISDSTPVVVNMNVENNVSSGSSSDIDGILSSITDGLSEAMAISSEGVHV